MVAYGTGPAGDDDEFRYPLSPNQVDSLLNPTVRFEKYDLATNERLPDSIGTVTLESSAITRYAIKEDWIWDRQRGERYVRIIGIAPRIEEFDEDGISKGFKTLFWLYYPECRYVLANADAFNPMNDAQRRTYEDLFQKRFFSSFIIKEAMYTTVLFLPTPVAWTRWLSQSASRKNSSCWSTTSGTTDTTHLKESRFLGAGFFWPSLTDLCSPC